VKLKSVCSALCLIAVPVQAAPPPPKPVTCVTKAELHAGLAFIMQEVLVAVGSKCGSLLGETSYLRAKGPSLVSRYSEAAEAGTADLDNLIKRLGPDFKIADGDPVAMKAVFSTLITNQLGKILVSKSCADVDQVLGLLDPLPAQNMLGLIEFAIQKVDEGDRVKRRRSIRSSSPTLCREPVIQASNTSQ
jgi:hypothetical protein